MQQHKTVAVIGLGYVGLPLATAFGRVVPTIGFDVNMERIASLRQGIDWNGEVEKGELKAPQLKFTHDASDLVNADFFIVAVPTPTDKAKRPDLRFLVSASQTVGEILQRRAKVRAADAPFPVVVFESTVYPGCTEEDCVPIIERTSGLSSGRGFKVGYSPERINPGDKQHTFESIVKVVSGQDEETLEVVAEIYGRVVKAGVYRAPSIKVAEAAKVIENTQRDINIALMNELSILFHRLGIDTLDVLKAAGTKWNFLPFRPGLVGGHCIPEDPYYLTHKAVETGYYPQLILAGRRLNDEMGRYVARETVKLLIKSGHRVQGARVLVLGVTFKENVPDTRNTRVTDILEELEGFGCLVSALDPLVSEEALHKMGFLNSVESEVDCIVLAVPHRCLMEELSWTKYLPRGGVLVDVKGALDSGLADSHGWTYWRL